MNTDDLAVRRARRLPRRTAASGFLIPGAPPPEELLRYQVAWLERADSLLRMHAAWAGAPAAKPEELADSVRRAAATLAGLRTTMHPPLDEYCDQVGLDARDRDALALIAGPHLDPTLRQQMTKLRGRLDVGLIATLLAETRADIVHLGRRLGRHGALASSGLVTYTAPREGNPPSELDYEMAPSARLLGLLEGEVRLGAGAGDDWELAQASPDAADGILPGGASHPDLDFARRVCGSADAPRRGCVLVNGPQGVGRRGVVEALAARVGYRYVLVVEHSLLPRPPGELGARVEQLSREAGHIGALLLIEHVRCDENSADTLRMALRRAQRPVALTADPLDGQAVCALAQARIELARPDGELRAHAWRAELARAGIALTEVEQRRLATDVPVMRPAIATAVGLAGPQASAEVLERCARAQIFSQLARYAERTETRARLADLVLTDDAHQEVSEVIRAYQNRPAARVRWGERLTLGTGFVVLLNGPPGTGKSLSAQVIAHELGLPLYRIDVSRIFDRYVGETEKNLVRLFEEAAADHAALLFDEADSLFSRRVDVQDASDRHANNQVNVLLERIERHEGLVLLTTNLKGGIDEALLRRITFKIELDRPDLRERTALWRSHLPEDARAGDIDLVRLATQFRTSGADIRNAVTRAVLEAGDQPIEQALLRRSVEREIESAGGVVRRSP